MRRLKTLKLKHVSESERSYINAIALRDAITVGIGEYAIARNPGKIVTWALGSCIAIVLYDYRLEIGALAHAMLPRPPRLANDTPAKYVSTAIPLLIEELRQHGASVARLQAAIVGGANVLRVNGIPQVGQKNVEEALSILRRIPVHHVLTETGGTRGRNVLLDLETATVYVWSAGGGFLLRRAS